MLPIAGKTAGPNRRKLFVVTQGWPGVFKVVFSSFSTFFFLLFFHRQRQALQLVLNIMIIISKKYF